MALLGARFAAHPSSGRLSSRSGVRDVGGHLWKTFNRVQALMLQSGVRAVLRKERRTLTRAVTGIDQDLRLNRALWILVEQMKAMKH